MFLFPFVVKQLALGWRKETDVFTGAGSRCVVMTFSVSYACPSVPHGLFGSTLEPTLPDNYSPLRV